MTKKDDMEITYITLITLVTLLIALSGAAERLTEIIKGLIPFLNKENPDATSESRRRAIIHILAVGSGILTAFLSSPVVEPILEKLVGKPEQKWNSTLAIVALGLLSSAGASFWNSILEYLLRIKDIKEAVSKKVKVDADKAEELKEAEVNKAKSEADKAAFDAEAAKRKIPQ